MHALAAIMARGDMAENYCSKYYTKEQWSLAYYMTIYPVPHHSTWESFEIPEEIRSKVVFPSLRIWRKRKEDYKLLDSHLHENIIGRKRVGIHHWLVRMTKVTVISMKMREVRVREVAAMEMTRMSLNYVFMYVLWMILYVGVSVVDVFM